MEDSTPLPVWAVRAAAAGRRRRRLCTDLADVTPDLSALDSAGFWAVVIPFDGEPCAPASARSAPPGRGRAAVAGPLPLVWTTSLDRAQFTDGCHDDPGEIAAGDVYQVNLTRRLTRTTAPPHRGQRRSHDIAALGAALAEGTRPPTRRWCAYLARRRGGQRFAGTLPLTAKAGRHVVADQGHSRHEGGFLDKDRAENVMIVDLVRNDLGRVCEWGSVKVPSLLDVEPHPGLFHLVSTVTGTLRRGLGWAEAIDATFPPGSVTGHPRSPRWLRSNDSRPEARGIYCGAIGWVDADRPSGDLNVAIRTFWIEDGTVELRHRAVASPGTRTPTASGRRPN